MPSATVEVLSTLTEEVLTATVEVLSATVEVLSTLTEEVLSAIVEVLSAIVEVLSVLTEEVLSSGAKSCAGLLMPGLGAGLVAGIV